MIVVADSSPIIFLAKIGRTEWISAMFGPPRPLVPSRVVEEVLAPPLPPAEERILKSFLSTCEIVIVHEPRTYAAALSRADNDALSLAIDRGADLLLADDRLVRSVANLERIRPMGTLGILLRAARTGHATAREARDLLRVLVRSHGFRIGIEVFEAAMAELDSLSTNEG
jgi:uncharacterized protein